MFGAGGRTRFFYGGVMFGWPDLDWSYVPYQAGMVIIHGAKHPIKSGFDGELMNLLVAAGGEPVTLNEIADQLYKDKQEPEWLDSEIKHRVTRCRKYLAGGPIGIKPVYRKKGVYNIGRPGVTAWRLTGLRSIPALTLAET